MTLGKKLWYIGLQILVLMVGTLLVVGLSSQRSDQADNVSDEIAGKWGGPVWIKGPLLKKSMLSDNYMGPSSLNCNVSVETQNLHRGIYQVQVFTSKVLMRGTFKVRDSVLQDRKGYIQVRLNPSQLAMVDSLKIGDRVFLWKISKEGLYATVPADIFTSDVPFSTSFSIRGSQSIKIFKFDCLSNITIDGKAVDPSFVGKSLPSFRIVRKGRFAARWDNIDHSGEDLSADANSFVGTEFQLSLNDYRKVTRSLSYSIFIILMAYLSVLVMELLTKRNMPLVNYFLIGVSVVIFFILLLSFSEVTTFGGSYLIAASMTSLLIALYSWKSFGSVKLGILTEFILTSLFGICYLMVISSEYALVIGSLLVFFAIATMMYATLSYETDSQESVS